MDKENSILFLGDVVPYKPFKFKNTYKTVINLESPIIKNGNPVTGKINLMIKENYLKNIFGDNLFGVSIGNNHILDFGLQGLESTLKELKKLNTNYFGLIEGNDNNNPLLIEFNKIKIAFISVVCQSTSPLIDVDNITYLGLLNPDEIISRVSKIRKLVNRVVVCIHWGIEESSLPAKEDISIARKLVEAGVDIIIGSHAHAPQPIEKYKNGIIAYNLGNFIMPEMKNIMSYFNEKGMPQSTYSKKIMIWNRISWGLIIDMESLEYKIKRYIFLSNRIIELPFSQLGKYNKLSNNIFDPSYDLTLGKHIKKREFIRRITDFIYRPHIPQKLSKKLWK